MTLLSILMLIALRCLKKVAIDCLGKIQFADRFKSKRVLGKGGDQEANQEEEDSLKAAIVAEKVHEVVSCP